MKIIQSFLEMVNKHSPEKAAFNGYRSMADFLLRNGSEFKPTPLPKGTRTMPLGNCFQNAAMVAIDDERFTYVEGYAMSVFPVEHAWLTDDNGLAIDPTWDRVVNGRLLRGEEYFGIAINRQFLMRRLREQKVYGLLGWPYGMEVAKVKQEEWMVKFKKNQKGKT